MFFHNFMSQVLTSQSTTVPRSSDFIHIQFCAYNYSLTVQRYLACPLLSDNFSQIQTISTSHLTSLATSDKCNFLAPLYKNKCNLIKKH